MTSEPRSPSSHPSCAARRPRDFHTDKPPGMGSGLTRRGIGFVPSPEFVGLVAAEADPAPARGRYRRGQDQPSTSSATSMPWQVRHRRRRGGQALSCEARTQAGNQVRDVIISAPRRSCASNSVGSASMPRLPGRDVATRACQRRTAGDETSPSPPRRRHRALSTKITELDHDIAGLCALANRPLLAARPTATRGLLDPSAIATHRCGR